MAIIKTVIRIPSESRAFDVAADLNEQQVRAAYGTQLTALANMTCVETINTIVGGEERVLTFSPRSGNKGSKLA